MKDVNTPESASLLMQALEKEAKAQAQEHQPTKEQDVASPPLRNQTAVPEITVNVFVKEPEKSISTSLCQG